MHTFVDRMFPISRRILDFPISIVSLISFISFELSLAIRKNKLPDEPLGLMSALFSSAFERVLSIGFTVIILVILTTEFVSTLK